MQILLSRTQAGPARTYKGASINDLRARGGEGGSRKVDKSTDKLCDHVCDKGGGGVKKFKIFMDVIDGSPLRHNKNFEGTSRASESSV